MSEVIINNMENLKSSPKTSTPHVSLVVPAHNEEGNLRPLLEKILPVMENNPEIKSYEILFVNDNSRDKTPEIIEDLAKTHSCVRTLHRWESPGFGNAVKAGLKEARGEIVIPLMADLSEEPEDIVRLVKKMEEGYDVVYGSRFCPGGSTNDYPLIKLLLNRLGNHAIGLLFGLPHRDITNAFKAYRREVLEAIGFENMEAEHFDLTIEIPLKAHVLGFKSVEVPVSWENRKVGEAKLKLTRHCQKYGSRLGKMFLWGNLVALKELFSSLGEWGWKKSLAGFGVGIALLIGIFHLFKFSRVFSLVEKVEPIYLFFGFLMLLSAFIIRTWRWSVLMRACGYRTPRKSLFKILLFGWFLNYLLPARVGDVARGVALKTSEGKPVLIGLFTVVIERSMDMFVLSLLLAGSLFFVSRGEELYSFVALGMAGAFLLVVIAFFLTRYDYVIFRKLSLQTEEEKKDMETLSKGLRKLWRDPFSLLLSLMLTPLIWFFEIMVLFFAGLSLGLWDQTAQLVVISSVVAFLSQALPTVPGGLGIHEGAVGGIWKFFGLSGTTGFTVALLDHFIRACLIYPLGALATIHIAFASRVYFRKKELVKSSEEKDHQN